MKKKTMKTPRIMTDKYDFQFVVIPGIGCVHRKNFFSINVIWLNFAVSFVLMDRRRAK